MKQKLYSIYKQYQNQQTPTIFTIIVLLSCYVSFHTLQNQISFPVKISFFIIAYIGAQNISAILSELKKVYTGVLDKIAICLICLLATYCETGAYYLEPIYKNPIPLIPFFLISAVWLSIVVLYLLYRGHKWIINQKIVENKGFSIKANLALIFTCILLCMLCNYAFNPAITSPDSQYCYNYAFHLGEGPICNGHPVFYIMLLKLCTLITSKIEFMIFIQSVYYALVFTYTLNILIQIGVSKKICLCIFLFIGIGFNTLIQISTLWKDIPFTISILWLTALLVKKCTSPQKCSENIWWYLQYTIASIFTALIRHNGLFPVIATLILAVIILKNKKRIIIASLAVIFVIITIKGPVYNRYQVYEDSGLKFCAMANDIMYLYHNKKDTETDPVLMQVVNDFTDGDPNNFPYNPYYTTLNRNNIKNYSIPEFLGIYFHAWKVHPRIMLKGFLSRNAVMWSIDKTANEIPGCVNYLGEEHIISFKEQYPKREPNFLTNWLTNIFNILTNNHFIYTFYWKTSIYNLLMIIGIIHIALRFKKKFANYVLPFTPIAVNIFVLSLTSGWPDYRYYWPSMLVASILLPYTVVLLAKKKID